MRKIGVFDSGIGGLTVARSLYNLKAFEELIYFGDIAHLPYGDKSESAIQAYSVRISEFLVAKGCEMIVIACNSASASATHLLREYLDPSIKVVNVIDPMVNYVQKRFPSGNIGLIGTKRTIESGIYQREIKDKCQSCEVVSLATPLLVPLIEEGIFTDGLKQQVIQEYLRQVDFSEIDALILGCTHYPLIRKEIQSNLKPNTAILESSDAILESMKMMGIESRGCNTKATFFASDLTPAFTNSAKQFFGEEITIQLHRYSNIF